MSRDTTEASKRIELSWLKTKGYFPREEAHIGGEIKWSFCGEPTGDIRVEVNTMTDPPYLRMKYRARKHGTSEEWRDKDYQFSLERLPCHFGGFKWFVRCQLSKNEIYCGRRVRVLYSVGDYFGCRHCANLTYQRCNYGGRYKGFLSIPDLDEQEEKVKRRFYRGKPTRKYRRLLQMEEKFNISFVNQALWLTNKAKK